MSALVRTNSVVGRCSIENDDVIRIALAEVADMDRVMARKAEAPCDVRRERVIYEDPHGLVTSGSSRSRNDSAGYRNASRLSSGSRSG